MVPRKKTTRPKKGKCPELTIIIPAYNEETLISKAVEDVQSSNPEALILAVEDGSTDKTGELLSAMRKKPCLTIIDHSKNEGYGAALKQGFRRIKTSYVGFLDADLTYDPRQFKKLLDEIKKNGLDCAWSNRFGGRINEMPAIRKVGNRFINLATCLLTGKNVKDCTSGQRVFKTEALQLLDYESLPDGLGFISALTKRTITRGLKYTTLPTDYLKRGGSSKQKIVTGFLGIMREVVKEK